MRLHCATITDDGVYVNLGHVYYASLSRSMPVSFPPPFFSLFAHVKGIASLLTAAFQ